MSVDVKGSFAVGKVTLAHAFVAVLLLVVGMLTAYGFDLAGVRPENSFLVFTLGIVIIVIETNSPFWGVFLGVAYPVLFDFLLIEPRFRMHAYDPGFFLSCAVFVMVALILGSLTVRLRKQLERSEHDERVLVLLNKMGSSLINSSSAEDACQKVERSLHLAIKRHVDVSLDFPEEGDRAARLCFEAGCPAGAGETDYPDSSFLYLPLKAKSRTFGIVSIDCSAGPLEDSDRMLLDSAIAQTVVVLERNELEDATRDSRIRHEYERLKTNLLRSVSSNMKNPLAHIVSTIEHMKIDDDAAMGEKAADALHSVESDARGLMKTVDGLMSIVCVQDQGGDLSKKPVRVAALIADAVERVSNSLGSHRIEVSLEDEDLVAPLHKGLIEQVLVNLIDNAIVHTYPDAVISINAGRKLGMLVVSVADNGGGLAPDQIGTVLSRLQSGDAFPLDGSCGSGLGLAVCKSIVEAHDGFIVLENNPYGGVTASFSLPMDGALS